MKSIIKKIKHAIYNYVEDIAIDVIQHSDIRLRISVDDVDGLDRAMKEEIEVSIQHALSDDLENALIALLENPSVRSRMLKVIEQYNAN